MELKVIVTLKVGHEATPPEANTPGTQVRAAG